MYNPGDYAVVSRYDACRGDPVGHPSVSCPYPFMDYHTHCPVSKNCVAHIPCNISRHVITKEQVVFTKNSLPCIKIRTEKGKRGIPRYKDTLVPGRPEAPSPLIMETWQVNESKITEAAILNEAETAFNSEINQACCDASDAENIQEMVITAGRQNEVIT